MKWTGEDGAALSHPSLKSKTPRSGDRSTPVTPPATSTNTDSLFFFQSVFFSFLRKQAKGKKKYSEPQQHRLDRVRSPKCTDKQLDTVPNKAASEPPSKNRLRWQEFVSSSLREHKSLRAEAFNRPCEELPSWGTLVLSSGDNEVHCDNIERVTTSERTPPPFFFPGAFLLPPATEETGELKEIKEWRALGEREGERVAPGPFFSLSP